MENITLYRKYLAADAARKRLEPFGVRIEDIRLSNEDHYAHYWNQVEASLKAGETPFAWAYCAPVKIDLTQDDFVKMLPEELQALSYADEDRQQALRDVREQYLIKLLNAFPDFKSFRDPYGQSMSLIFEPLDGVHVKISVGAAMCQRVLVRHDVKQVPDPEFVAKAPMIEELVPVYETRCNDSLLNL